jgi:uncharacterized protein (DUF433 family)
MVHERIRQDPDIMTGKPVIAGTRITVELLLRRLGHGDSPDDLLRDFPGLTLDDVRAAQVFAADALAGFRQIAAE